MVRAHVEAKPRQRATGAARYLDRGRRLSARRRRRSWWRSAACRAPANRPWRARWRRSWARRPARWCCAATRSASASTASRRSSGCRRAAYTEAASEAVFAELAALGARWSRAGGHAVIADAMFLRPAQRAAVAAGGETRPACRSSACGCTRRWRCWKRASPRARAMPRTRRSPCCARGRATIPAGGWTGCDRRERRRSGVGRWRDTAAAPVAYCGRTANAEPC